MQDKQERQEKAQKCKKKVNYFKNCIEAEKILPNKKCARSDAYPEASALVASLREAGVPAAISGAGPSVIAVTDRAEDFQRMQDMVTSLGGPAQGDEGRWRVHDLAVSEDRLHVRTVAGLKRLLDEREVAPRSVVEPRVAAAVAGAFLLGKRMRS